MDAIIEQAKRELTAMGLGRVNARTWQRGDITVTYRPQEQSFLGHWTDGQRHDFAFFDFCDTGQSAHSYVMLLDWARHYQALPKREQLQEHALAA